MTLRRDFQKTLRTGFFRSILALITFECFSQAASSNNDACQNPDVLIVSSTLNQRAREGTYKVSLSLMCNSRKVWVQNPAPGSYSTQNFIYYNMVGVSWSGWLIGTDMCKTYGGIASMAHSPPTPYDPLNNGQWVEVYGGQWVQNPSLTVTCSTGSDAPSQGVSAAAIVGIVIAVCCGLLFSIFLIACCCMVAKKKAIANRTNQIVGNNSTGQPVYSVSGAMIRRGTQINPLPPDYYGNTTEVYSHTPITAPPYELICPSPPPPYADNLHNTSEISAPAEREYELPPPSDVVPQMGMPEQTQRNNVERIISTNHLHTSRPNGVQVGQDIKVQHH